MFVKRFFYVCAGLLCLALAYHLGSKKAPAQTAPAVIGTDEWQFTTADIVIDRVPHGDTDFSSTRHLDRWEAAGVRFLFGIDAMPNLKQIASELSERGWKRLHRPAKYAVQTQARRRRENVKEQVVVERSYRNLRLNSLGSQSGGDRPRPRSRNRLLLTCMDTARAVARNRIRLRETPGRSTETRGSPRQEVEHT